MIKKILKKILPFKIIKFYRKIKSYLEYIKFKNNIKNFRKKNKDILLVVGAGDTKYNFWISTNYPWFNISKIDTFNRYFKGREVSKILAEHVFEHLTLEDGIKSIKNLKTILKPQGKIRIAVPDGYNPNKDYINHVKPGGTGAGADDHKILYDYKSIKKLFDDDFKINYLEYFNEFGKFVSNEWINDEKNGYIKRSRLEDKRNSKDEIKFNSIILDAVLIK